MKIQKNVIGKNKQIYNEKKAWGVLLVVFLASITVTMSMMKVPPLMDELIEDLNTNTAIGGLFMSSFMVAGVVLAIPVASLLNNWGPKKCGVIALGCIIIGSIFGSSAQELPIILLIGRSIEGIGFAIMMVTAPTVISMWFKPDKRGLPMGIWATWVPVGLFIIYNLAKTIEIAFTWRGVWWFNAIFALIVLIIYYKIVDFPLKEWEYNKKSEKTQKIKISQGIKNTNTLRLTIIFMVIGMSMQGYSTWLPTYLKNTGLNATDANFSASLITMGMIPAIVLAGLILNHTKNHKYILTTGLSLTAIILILWFSFGNNFSVIPWMIAIGLSSGLTPTCIFTMASETVIRPEFAGIALAMVNMGYNFGAIIGPPIVGTIINKLGWNPVKYFVVIPITITIILAISIIEKKK